jgi:formylglycine-generating enzyme required for sulfatase activity
MKLTTGTRRAIKAVLARPKADVAELARIAGLDPRRDFIGADFRNFDFGAADLANFNFSRADLSGADFTHAKNIDTIVFVDAKTEGAKGLPSGRVVQDAPDLPILIRIPAGSFLMGTPAAENKREKAPEELVAESTPQRRMTIPKPFLLGKTPVTVGQFDRFAVATNYKIEPGAYTYEPDEKGKWNYKHRDNRDWRNPGFPQTDDHPVVCVNHGDALAYLDWLSELTNKPYRLPSEAEWEYAARAGTTAARFWGDGRDEATRYAKVADAALMRVMKREFDPERFFSGDSGYPFTAPVGHFLPNPFGLYDMLGNVWEWMADHWTEKLSNLPKNGTPYATSDSAGCALRGGAWIGDPRIVRAGIRLRSDSGDRNLNVGFRVARTL